MLPWSSAMLSGVAPPAPGLVERVGLLALVARRPVEQPRDRGADELDVADLLGADALDQVAVRLRRRAAEVDALEQVLHHRPHLAELAAEPLLQGVGGGRIRLVLLDLVDQMLHVEVHGSSFGVVPPLCSAGDPAVGGGHAAFPALIVARAAARPRTRVACSTARNQGPLVTGARAYNCLQPGAAAGHREGSACQRDTECQRRAIPRRHGQSGSVETAKQEAGELKDTAVSEAGHVAETAKGEAKAVAQEVKYQAKDLYAQTQRELKDQAQVQQQRVAAGLRSVSDELQSMTANAENPGLAADLLNQVSTRLSGAASWLGDRDPSAVLSEVKSFARRKPGTFIIGAAILGIVAGRLTRALAANASDEHADHGGGSRSCGIQRARGSADVVGAAVRHAADRGGDPCLRAVVRCAGRQSFGGTSAMSDQTPSEVKAANTSLGDLLGEVTRDLSTLIRQEMALAKAELKESAGKAAKGAGTLGGAGVRGAEWRCCSCRSPSGGRSAR